MGIIYYIQAGNTKFWKVGYSNSVKGAMERLENMQTGNHHKLHLRAVEPAYSRQHETKIHSILFRRRVRREWFEFCPWIASAVEQQAVFNVHPSCKHLRLQ